jgi:hypothetical protein
MRNIYFSDKVRSEQNLYEDIIIESLKIYGQDVYYLPRDTVGEDRIFGDEVPARYNSNYKVEMYIDNIEGFDGEGDLFSRFGVEIRDEATFVVARKRWTSTVGRYDNEINSVRPLEGDLIYLPMSKSLFQIMHVEHEQPFYQLSNLPVYRLRAQLFEYNDEDMDTGVAEIDNIEAKYAYSYVISVNAVASTDDLRVGDTFAQSLPDGINKIRGEISTWSHVNNTITLVHVGAEDGEYHEFVPGEMVQERLGKSYTISSITEDNKISSNEQNDDFQTEFSDFLDFSESNPFGDPS